VKNVGGATPRGRPGNTWKSVVYYDTNDLRIKLSDGIHRGKWRRMIGGKWSVRNSD